MGFGSNMVHDLSRKLRVKQLLFGMMHVLRRLRLKLRTHPLPATLLDHLSVASVSLGATLRALRRGKRPRKRSRRGETAQTPQVASSFEPSALEVSGRNQQA